ncbi:type VII secretion target [Actinoplanes sp. NPDC026619]|uniref:type VII secretion target n=1 Tax=Actinoplanes sp. NPDC026619 TaxID=3155798 RepID=UPI0033EFF62A
MADGFTADSQQLRAHAAKIDAIQARFATVLGASRAIAQDDEAYGRLCGWISAILERRHTRQDELIAYVAENLHLASEALIQTGGDYDRADDSAAERLRQAGGR